jgi:DNA-binding NarL/FixJ family response regulator
LEAILIALILGFAAVTIFSLAALIAVRKREQRRKILDSEYIEKTIEDFDKAVNSAIEEVNKLGALIQKEVDEKYKSILFLYNLVEDKHKEIAETADSEVISEMMEKLALAQGEKIKQIAEESLAEVAKAALPPASETVNEAPEPPAPKKRPKFTNEKQEQIWNMRESGKKPFEIAKELEMGKGEVSLILNLIDRAS